MNILRPKWGILLLVFLFASCVKEVSYYDEEIPQGNIVMKNLMPQRVSEEMILKIIKISDARCPVGVVCVTQGEVGIGFEAYVKGEFVELHLFFDALSNRDDCYITIEGHRIQVIQVDPYPYANESVLNANDYRIMVKVEKL